MYAGTFSNAAMMSMSGRVLSEKLDVLRLTFYTSPISCLCLLPFYYLREVCAGDFGFAFPASLCCPLHQSDKRYSSLSSSNQNVSAGVCLLSMKRSIMQPCLQDCIKQQSMYLLLCWLMCGAIFSVCVMFCGESRGRLPGPSDAGLRENICCSAAEHD